MENKTSNSIYFRCIQKDGDHHLDCHHLFEYIENGGDNRDDGRSESYLFIALIVTGAVIVFLNRALKY